MLVTGFEYDVILDDNFKAMINENNVTYEIKNTNLVYVYIAVELPTYTYKYLSRDNQELKKGKINSYTYTIDCDYNKFELLKI